ncbi:MAG: hypothetical protein WC205_18385 [Opitutaceae bacterium]|jgi:hypothetical protein
MDTKVTKSSGRWPTFRWSHYRVDTSKAQPMRVEDIPIDALPNHTWLSNLPEFKSDLYYQAGHGCPPFFHAYTSEIADHANRRHYLHVSCNYGERPFLWLSGTQYKKCRPGNSHFHRVDLVPLIDGLGARWHRFTYVVSYDFTYVQAAAHNDTAESDFLTFLPPGQKKSRRFNLTSTGELPIIASNFKHQRHVIDIL